VDVRPKSCLLPAERAPLAGLDDDPLDESQVPRIELLVGDVVREKGETGLGVVLKSVSSEAEMARIPEELGNQWTRQLITGKRGRRPAARGEGSRSGQIFSVPPRGVIPASTTGFIQSEFSTETGSVVRFVMTWDDDPVNQRE
jgi:hypothetical protein